MRSQDKELLWNPCHRVATGNRPRKPTKSTMNHCHESLIDFPVVITVPLLWGDHDAFGHVNNLVYLRWCETARVEYLLLVGLWPSLPPAGLGPILANISCDYKRPLTFPDRSEEHTSELQSLR